MAKTDAACLTIETIAVRGVERLPQQAIRALTSSYEGKCLGLSELNTLLEQLTFLYVDKGYIASRAFLPEQDLSDGALEIIVVEGRLKGIVLDGEAGSDKSEIRMAFPAMIGEPVNLRDIEQGLDQLNRLRVNNATVALDAGKAPGDSILSVTRNQGKHYDGSVGFDNIGASATGEYQSRIDFAVEDVFHLNERWRFSYQRSMARNPWSFSHAPGGDTYTGAFSLPYGYWTFTLDGLSSTYDSRIDGALSAIDTSGRSRAVRASLSRVVHRDRRSITSLSGTLAWKRTENFILGSRLKVSSRDLSIGSLELLHSRRLWNGQLLASASYHRGLGLFGSFDDKTAPAGSPKGRFRRVNVGLDYFRPLRFGHFDATYSGQLSGQYSPDRLFASEQLAYGGYGTVRGLRESALFGNRGVMTRHEFAL